MSVHNGWVNLKSKAGDRVSPEVGLAIRGPILACEVRVDAGTAIALTTAGKPVPQGIRGSALIDTGATGSGVDAQALQSLGLAPKGFKNIGGVGSSKPHGVYSCGLGFPGGTVPAFPRVFVIEADLAQHGLVALIGRDLLSRGVLIYNGMMGYWSLSF